MSDFEINHNSSPVGVGKIVFDFDNAESALDEYKVHFNSFKAQMPVASDNPGFSALASAGFDIAVCKDFDKGVEKIGSTVDSMDTMARSYFDNTRAIFDEEKEEMPEVDMPGDELGDEIPAYNEGGSALITEEISPDVKETGGLGVDKINTDVYYNSHDDTNEHEENQEKLNSMNQDNSGRKTPYVVPLSEVDSKDIYSMDSNLKNREYGDKSLEIAEQFIKDMREHGEFNRSHDSNYDYINAGKPMAPVNNGDSSEDIGFVIGEEEPAVSNENVMDWFKSAGDDVKEFTDKMQEDVKDWVNQAGKDTMDWINQAGKGTMDWINQAGEGTMNSAGGGHAVPVGPQNSAPSKPPISSAGGGHAVSTEPQNSAPSKPPISSAGGGHAVSTEPQNSAPSMPPISSAGGANGRPDYVGALKELEEYVSTLPQAPKNNDSMVNMGDKSYAGVGNATGSYGVGNAGDEGTDYSGYEPSTNASIPFVRDVKNEIDFDSVNIDQPQDYLRYRFNQNNKE